MSNITSYYDAALDDTADSRGEPAEQPGAPDDGARRQTRLGDLVLFLTSADRTRIGSYSERQRYITIGLLMLVTAAQAFYAACLLASVGFKRPFDQVIGFGVFFAAAVFLIDRSIIGYVPPTRFDRGGRPAAPRRFTTVVVVRLVIAVAAAMLMYVVVLKISLQNDFARSLATAGAAGDLSQELEGALCSSEIRHTQSGVCANYAHQRDAVDVVSLGDHLRAYDQIELSFVQRVECSLEVFVSANGIAVEAGNARLWEDAVQ